jgi:urea transport system substrate-binding protein
METPKKTILIVDDEREILITLKEFLEVEGYRVLVAENGFDALKILDQGEIPNLILLDMKMPIMNGWAFAIEFLNRHDHLSPIVVITAAGDAEQRARDIGAIGWVEKPFDLNQLLKKIEKYSRSPPSLSLTLRG